MPFLGDIPLIPDVVAGGDTGVPILLSNPDSPASLAYKELAGKVAAQISINQASAEKKIDSSFELAWKA
ncbi:hypothetical protein NITGR_750046 [Nitrospina gracilis 3/211]|uniref:Uncharacterized protein n=1 Tax=Nitrospina gracilis (strain 3/211) TaxID=1266370 RepID=M1Z1X0_NITG3|nr:hypothetical protein NITGR_750046 [Nitrospina gracilis 3/211]